VDVDLVGGGTCSPSAVGTCDRVAASESAKSLPVSLCAGARYGQLVGRLGLLARVGLLVRVPLVGPRHNEHAIC